MAKLQRIDGLELQQDLRFQQRSWAVQRIGWIVMALVIAAALLGLFGGCGPLNRATVTDDASLLTIEYERLARFQNLTRLRIHTAADAARENTVRIWLSREFVQGAIQQINPEPQSIEAAFDRFTYVFVTTEPRQPIVVTFYLQPNEMGLHNGRVAIEGAPALDLTQFVYP